MTDEEFVLQNCVHVLTNALNKFVGECMDEQGKPKQPSYKALMEARGMLPKRCSNAFPEKGKK